MIMTSNAETCCVTNFTRVDDGLRKTVEALIDYFFLL